MSVLLTRVLSPLTVGSRTVKETPVFKTGPSATGQYEAATFQPDSSSNLNNHERGFSGRKARQV